jgi:hypothetical protein
LRLSEQTILLKCWCLISERLKSLIWSGWDCTSKVFHKFSLSGWQCPFRSAKLVSSWAVLRCSFWRWK